MHGDLAAVALGVVILGAVALGVVILGLAATLSMSVVTVWDIGVDLVVLVPQHSEALFLGHL
jgi:hypothetical protein